MTIQLMMRPSDEPMTWDAFCRTTPPFSIAIDGYVADGPRFDEAAPRANFNHHEVVDRLATRATCAQVLIAVRMGLYQRFRDRSGLHAVIYANDCDEDVCASFFVLSRPDMSRPTANPALNRLIGLVDALDTTAGAYPYEPDLGALRELAWIFEPYRRHRAAGGLKRRNADEFSGVVTDVVNRMTEYVTGHGRMIEPDTTYERLGGGSSWTMFREIGTAGRVGAFRDGVRAYVVVRDDGEGRYAYTVGRASHFVSFDVPGILKMLDAAEGDPARHWGGGNTIGGSPRATGSRLDPVTIERLINDFLRTKTPS